MSITCRKPACRAAAVVPCSNPNSFSTSMAPGSSVWATWKVSAMYSGPIVSYQGTLVRMPLSSVTSFAATHALTRPR